MVLHLKCYGFSFSKLWFFFLKAMVLPLKSYAFPPQTYALGQAYDATLKEPVLLFARSSCPWGCGELLNFFNLLI
ncbi:MAG: hypothetical protein IJ604_12160 [Prevotella sp.]|nr:hypothetical protein [Prevotella sp.]